MSSFRIEKYSFNQAAVATLSEDKEKNWPVVYQIRNSGKIYIGETTNLKNRMRQHLDSEEKANLRGGVFNVVFDDTFNKSAALDLESYLIRYFSGDGHYKVLNRNDGMLDRDYYDRDNYRKLLKIFGNVCAS